jgi:beta-ribofuranosylaminobenzene 5'-phosphate synthase
LESFTHFELLRSIRRVERGLGGRLSEGQKILLTTDGSVTRILEILTGRPVVVETLSRRMDPADREVAGWLGVDVGSRVNYRVVKLGNRGRGRVLVVAWSWIALSRLSGGMRRDLTSTDIPIGKIILKHRLEVRREILSIDLVPATREQAEYFKIQERSPLISKVYNIIRGGDVLIRINEFFRP